MRQEAQAWAGHHWERRKCTLTPIEYKPLPQWLGLRNVGKVLTHALYHQKCMGSWDNDIASLVYGNPT